jgi:hypothetical protein
MHRFWCILAFWAGRNARIPRFLRKLAFWEGEKHQVASFLVNAGVLKCKDVSLLVHPGVRLGEWSPHNDDATRAQGLPEQ